MSLRRVLRKITVLAIHTVPGRDASRVRLSCALTSGPHSDDAQFRRLRLRWSVAYSTEACV